VKRRSTCLGVVAGFCSLIWLASCSVIAPSSKQVAGAYFLTRWEDFKTYYLEENGKGETMKGGGAIDGTVLRIGWTGSVIAVNRKPTLATVKSDWVLIDVAKRTVSDPMTEEAFLKMQQTDPALSSMTMRSAADAWRLLK
jgi:hypothetical protein